MKKLVKESMLAENYIEYEELDELNPKIHVQDLKELIEGNVKTIDQFERIVNNIYGDFEYWKKEQPHLNDIAQYTLWVENVLEIVEATSIIPWFIDETRLFNIPNDIVGNDIFIAAFIEPDANYIETIVFKSKYNLKNIVSVDMQPL